MNNSNMYIIGYFCIIITENAYAIKYVYTVQRIFNPINGLLTNVYINLLDQKEPKLNFNNQNEKIKNESGKRVSVYSKKVIIPSAEEIKNHKEFLKKDLKKNLF